MIRQGYSWEESCKELRLCHTCFFYGIGRDSRFERELGRYWDAICDVNGIRELTKASLIEVKKKVRVEARLNHYSIWDETVIRNTYL